MPLALLPLRNVTRKPTDPPNVVMPLHRNRVEFRDLFDRDHNFLEGVSGTAWDGIFNAEQASHFNRNRASTSELTIRNSTNTRFVDSDFNAPYLYKKISGDFEATMEISFMASMELHTLAILAADPHAWDREFVWVGQQNGRGNSDFALGDNIQNGSLYHENRYAGDFSYYRLIRAGDRLTGYLSADGLLWHPFAEHVRPDFPETLLVGITQSSLSSRSATARVGSFQIKLLWRPGDFDHNGSFECADIAELGRGHRGSCARP